MNGVATITTAGVGCTNNTPVANEATCTWYLPEDEVLTTGAVALPEKGATKETIEHFLHTGTQINNAIVTSAVSTSAVTLPEPICFDDGILDGTGNPTVPHTIHNLAPGSTQDCSTPPAGCCYEFGPLFGVGSLNATIDWLLPGTEHCGTLTGNVPDPRTCAVSNNIAGLTNGYDLGLLPIGFPAAALITPHSGEAAVAAAWNYSAKLNADSWPGIPGQGGWASDALTGGRPFHRVVELSQGKDSRVHDLQIGVQHDPVQLLGPHVNAAASPTCHVLPASVLRAEVIRHAAVVGNASDGATTTRYRRGCVYSATRRRRPCPSVASEFAQLDVKPPSQGSPGPEFSFGNRLLGAGGSGFLPHVPKKPPGHAPGWRARLVLDGARWRAPCPYDSGPRSSGEGRLVQADSSVTMPRRSFQLMSKLMSARPLRGRRAVLRRSV